MIKYFATDDRRFRVTTTPKTPWGWLKCQLGLSYRQILKIEVIYGPPLEPAEYDHLSARLAAEVFAAGGSVYTMEGR